jgi:hypothetical protein
MPEEDNIDSKPITCQDCDEQPVLYETPYLDNTDYVVACDCDMRGVDVSDTINGNSLVHPLSGRWSNIDHNSEFDRL